METHKKMTGQKRPMAITILYGVVIIIVVVVAAVLVAKFAFNVDLVNFGQLSGMMRIRR